MKRRFEWLGCAVAALLAAGSANAETPWRTTLLSSPHPPANTYVLGVWPSPDGRVVVYGLRQAGDSDARELRCIRQSAEVDSISLTSGFPASYRFGVVTFSPNARRIVVSVVFPVTGGTVEEIWSIPVCEPGATPVRLSPAGEPALFSGSGFHRFTPDSQRVLYLSTHAGGNVYRLYSAPADGSSAPVELGGAVPGESGILDLFIVSADSQRVITGRRAGSGIVDLVSLPVAGPAAGETVLVHGTSPSAGYPYVPYDRYAGDRLVYLWNDESAGGVRELYSAPTDGPADQQVKLHPQLAAGGAIWDFDFAPDESRVVYLADQETDEVFEVYSVPIAGPASAGVRLNGALPAGSQGVYRFGRRPYFLPDSSRVVFQAEQDSPTRFDVYSAPAAGPAGSAVRLNQGEPQGNLYGPSIATADSQLVLFTGSETTPSSGDLHARPADGSGTQLDLECTQTNAVLPTRGGRVFVTCVPSSSTARQVLVYDISAAPLSAIQEDATPIDDLGAPTELLEASPASRGVLISSESPTPGKPEAYAVDERIFLDGFEAGSAVRWSSALP